MKNKSRLMNRSRLNCGLRQHPLRRHTLLILGSELIVNRYVLSLLSIYETICYAKIDIRKKKILVVVMKTNPENSL